MVIVETPFFTRRVLALLPDKEYRKLQSELVARPLPAPSLPAPVACEKSAGARADAASAAACAFDFSPADPDVARLRAAQGMRRTSLPNCPA